MKIEQYNILDLTTHPKNPRILKDDMYVKAKNEMSKESFSWLQPIVINKKHKIKDKFVVLGGNQRLTIAKELYSRGNKFFETIPIVSVEIEPNSKEEFSMMIKLNKNWGDWDWTELANLNFDMKDFYEDMFFDIDELSKGFQIDTKDIENMINNDNEEIESEDINNNNNLCPYCGKELSK